MTLIDRWHKNKRKQAKGNRPPKQSGLRPTRLPRIDATSCAWLPVDFLYSFGNASGGGLPNEAVGSWPTAYSDEPVAGG